MGAIEDRLRELGLTLPPLGTPPGGRPRLMRARSSGNLLYLSGNGPLRDGQIAYRGKVGQDLTIEEGYEAARLTALNLLAVIKDALGDLDRVSAFVKHTSPHDPVHILIPRVARNPPDLAGSWAL